MQLELAASVTPETETTPPEADAEPPQVLCRLLGLDKDMPEGNASLTPTPVKEIAFEFESVSVMVNGLLLLA